MYAQAGEQTVTIGNRNAGQSKGSVFIGELDGYNDGRKNDPVGMKNNYVTAVGFQSNATGWGSIAIGSNAVAENTKETSQVVDYEGSAGTSGTVQDDNYGIKLNPSINWSSVALGYSAKAKDGNIAIGAYSDATDTSSATPYVSVGNTNIKRRITNVADGTETTDVATVGQLQELSKELGGYKAGFGITIATDSTDKTKNKISLKRNLGRDANTKDKAVLKADEDKSALVIGGRVNQGDTKGGQTTEKDYGALGQDSVTVGGADNTASGDAAVVVGGLSNTASAQYSAVVGGSANDAIGNESSVFGGFNNDATGLYATISGGSYNRTYGEAASVFGGSMNNAVGSTSSVFGGSINTANGIWSSVVGGSHNTTLGLSSTAVGGENTIVDGTNSVGIAGGSTKADNALAAGNEATVTVNNGTAIGYQATANKEGTVAFGHDKGDVYYTSTWFQKATKKDGKYYDADNKEITEAQYEALRNADTTFNDYSKNPTVTENPYTSAAYNRLVKVADGVDDHDVVVMEQLKNASGVGSKIKVYQTDKNGNIKFDKNNNPIEDTSDSDAVKTKREAAQKASEDAWGEAIGTGHVADPKASNAKDNGSGQLVTGGTVYDALQKQKTDLTNSLSVNAGWGINVADEKDPKTGNVTKKNVISLNRNLGNIVHLDQSGEPPATVTVDKNGMILGGKFDTDHYAYDDRGYWGATGDSSVLVGGKNNLAKGAESVVLGGCMNRAIGERSSILGGDVNFASGFESAVVGGSANYALGDASLVLGGEFNYAIESGVQFGSTVLSGEHNYSHGKHSTVVGGLYNLSNGNLSVALGGEESNVYGDVSTGIAGGSTGKDAQNALAAGPQSTVTVRNGTAIGYQATTNQAGTIAFGHDQGDIYYGSLNYKGSLSRERWPQKAYSGFDGKYYDANDHEITVEKYMSLKNPDGTLNDYSKEPYFEDTYKTASYNRLVKVADGQKAHDTVVMEQLTPYTKFNASNIGANLKTYTVGNDGETITEADASDADKTVNENAWGTAIGNGSIADPTQSATNDPKKNGSQQLVTGGTVYKALHGGLTDITIGKNGKDGQDGKEGSIGLNGKDGQDGITTTVIKTEKGQPGADGKTGAPGVDGTNITRIVYDNTANGDGEHTVATLDDGMKYAGDTGAAAKVKLDHQLKLSGTTFNETDKKYKETDWTSDNIAVVSSAADETTGDATMYLKLNKDLNLTDKGSVRFGDKDSSTTLDASGLTIKSTITEDGNTKTVTGPSVTKDGIHAGNKVITDVGSGLKDGKYSEDKKNNAANLGDVNSMVNEAVKDASDTTNKALDTKANVDASNIGSNIKVYKTDKDGKVQLDENNQPIPDETASKTAQDTNANKWGTAIGTGKIADPNAAEKLTNGSQQLVTGGTVYEALHGGLDDIVIGHDGKDGSIGLVGPTGPKGEDGTTIIKTEKGADGVDGKNGEDGITRIVYNDTNNPDKKHTVATLDDGMKYAGDTGDAAKVKLDHQLKLSGTTFNETDKKYKETDWTSDNIAVVSSAADETTGDATMYLKLNKDLNLTDKGSVRFGDKDSSTTLDASGLTIKSTVTEDGNTKTVNGPSMTKDGIDGGSKAITNIGSGIEKDNDGNYTDKSKSSAANIGDVQTIVNDAKKDLTDGKNGLNSKANVDASNIGENMKDAKGNKASAAEITKNKEAWASAIGTDTVAKGNKQLVTSDAVATALDSKADKTYVDKQLDTKANKSDVYTKDQTYSKSEVDSKVSDITTGLDGKAGKDLGNISDKGQQVIHNIAKDAVEVVDGTNTTVTKTDGTNTTPTRYAVNVEGKGKVASGDTGLISGDTLYNEVHVNTDGSYIKGSNTVGKNLSKLDTGLKTTSDLIHTNEKGDAIQIGSNSTATKIDVSGKDKDGKSTGRVITGVVSDASNPNSAANIGYVNGVTAANTQQIYRDMNNAYSRLDTNINRAAAGSNALAALHPLDFDPADKASFAVGYGHYHNANAAAVGAFYQPNANTMVNMGISLGNGDPGFNAGVSFKIGKGSTYNGVSKAEMAQTIHDQAAEISTIKANDAAKDKRIDALEKENQEMKKQIQEILARLNG